MRAGESFTGVPDPTTLATSTSSSFVLVGGKYWFAAAGTFNGASVALQKLGPDGQTYLTIGSFTLSEGIVLDCPPGQYRVQVSGSTTASLSWEVVRTNEE